jgi:hypothetical protein
MLEGEIAAPAFGDKPINSAAPRRKVRTLRFCNVADLLGGNRFSASKRKTGAEG